MIDDRQYRATSAAEDRDRAHAQEPDDVLVTADSHPAIFLCLEDISHDMGAGAGHTNYSLPIAWADYLTPEHEVAVAALTTKERQIFSIGEETESMAIVASNPLLGRVHHLLEAFFEDFDGDQVP